MTPMTPRLACKPSHPLPALPQNHHHNFNFLEPPPAHLITATSHPVHPHFPAPSLAGQSMAGPAPPAHFERLNPVEQLMSITGVLHGDDRGDGPGCDGGAVDGSESGGMHETAGRGRSCPVCDKVLSHSRNLLAHMRGVHEGIKDFHCSHCPFESTSRFNLRKHNKAKHPEKPI
mmetsp:Transcript_5981/g.15625  ORF Transcript_5981/g.15625 Transcript_5981/m.15625 type:complete len:174 (+) Transcript_5981:162-683(+)